MRVFLKSWYDRQSLALKLSVSILVCVFTVFAALVVFLFDATEHIVGSKTEEIGQKSVETYVNDMTHLAVDTQQLVLNTKNMLNQLSESDVSSLQLVLNSAIKTIYHSALTFTDAWVYIFPPEDVSHGTLYRSENIDGKISFKSENITNLYDLFPWFKQVPKEEKIYWSEPYLDKLTSKTVVTCLVPFMFQGKTDFDGLVALTVDLTNMTRSINNFSFAETGKLLLISREGLYVAHPDPNIALKMSIFELSKKMELPQLAEAGYQVLSGKTGTTNIPYSSVFDTSVIFFYAPVFPLNWGLFLVYSEDALLKPIRHMQYLMILPLLVGMLILFFIIYKMCHHSTKQLLTLSHIASMYGQGDFSLNFDEVISSDEIGVLAKTMTNMRQNLLNYVEKEKKEASEKQRIESEMNIAASIQNAAMHKTFPNHPSFKVFASMKPARQVGGDFYDLFFLGEDKVSLVVADVSGKGIPAALFMMRGQALIKNVAKSGLGISEVFHVVNKELLKGNETCMFISAFLAVIDIKTGVMQYVNAGHTPLLVDNKEGYQYVKTQRNIVLGVQKDAVFKAESMRLKEGAKIFLYTDGVTEAENNNHQFYGQDRLLDVLKKPYDTPQETLKAVTDDIQNFADGNEQSDDITMMEFVYLTSSFDEIKVQSDMNNLSKVLNFIEDNMQKYHVANETVFKMVTAAEEIYANIASYAYEKKEEMEIVVKTHFDGTYYHIKFIDFGKEYNPLTRTDPDISAPLEERSIGGLGIFLVKKFASDVTYTRQNNQNVLKISIKV